MKNVALRKILRVLGLIFLFVGVVTALISDISSQLYKGEEVRAQADIYWIPHRVISGAQEWRARLSAEFKVGEVMSVVVEPNISRIGWGNVFLRSRNPKPVIINITGPSGKVASFKVFLIGYPEEASPEGIIPVGVFNYTLVQGSGDIEVRFNRRTNTPEEAGGIVKRNGVFTAIVEPPAVWALIPPGDVIMYALHYVKTYPYRILLPVGGILLFSGALMVFKAGKHRLRRRRYML